MLIESSSDQKQMQEVFENVSGYFSLFAEPMRLRILYALCNGEQTVAQIVAQSASTQANVSRHLNLLYRAKVLTRRKDGTHVHYRILNHGALAICKTVCREIASEMGYPADLIDGRIIKQNE